MVSSGGEFHPGSGTRKRETDPWPVKGVKQYFSRSSHEYLNQTLIGLAKTGTPKLGTDGKTFKTSQSRYLMGQPWGIYTLGLQSYLLFEGGTGLGARRVQSYLLRKYNWRCTDRSIPPRRSVHSPTGPC